MSILKATKIFYLCYFSKPISDRAIYRAIRRGRVRKIVELGIGSAARALRMIELAAAQIPQAEIHYAGIDLFEARSDGDGAELSLKTAHRKLRASGAKVQLVAGEPADSLVRCANSLAKVDLLIVSAGVDMSRARAWWFVPRLLHERTQVCVEERSDDGQPMLCWKTRAEIDRLAAAAGGRRAA